MSVELDRAHELHQQGTELCGQGKYREALPLLNQALAIAEQTLANAGPSPDAPEAFDRAKSVEYAALIKPCQALRHSVQEHLEQILTIQEQALGPEHPDTVQTLHSLAELHRTRHDYALALPLYERVLPVWERSWGRNIPKSYSAFFIWPTYTARRRNTPKPDFCLSVCCPYRRDG